MNMWKLALPASLLAVGTVLTVGVAPSYAGTFSGTYGFGPNTTNATETLVPVNPDTVNFGAFGGATVTAGFSTDLLGTRYAGTGWGTGSVIDTNTYFSFSVNPTLNNQVVSLTNFSFSSFSRSGNVNGGKGPKQWQLSYSTNGGTSFTAVANGVLNTPSSSAEQITASLVAVPALNTALPILFRLYGFGAVNGLNNNNNNFWSVDDVTLSGTASPVPTPAAIPAIIGFGVSLWRKRKQEDAVVA
jgi:hypothetical protein